jgi:hypothetical protein
VKRKEMIYLGMESTDQQIQRSHTIVKPKAKIRILQLSLPALEVAADSSSGSAVVVRWPNPNSHPSLLAPSPSFPQFLAMGFGPNGNMAGSLLGLVGLPALSVGVGEAAVGRGVAQGLSSPLAV